jgi:DNA ligase (NAD+)
MGIHIGDNVIIERCGEIIPDIVKVIPGKNRKPITIDMCPDCSSPVRYEEPFMYCTNKDCTGSLTKRLTDSCWRLGIENIGESTVSKLIEIGIQDIVDIIDVTESELLQLPGFGETSAKNLFNEIQKVINRPVEDWRILAALNK